MSTGMRAVAFDMDGVIFDSEGLVLDCWEKAGEKYGITGIREAASACIGTNDAKTREIMADCYGRDFPYDECRKIISTLFQEIVDAGGLAVKKGIRELLEYLKEREVLTALASSTGQESVTKELRQAGLYDYFRVVVGGDRLKNSKPAPDIYLMACAGLGVRPKDAYAIEDSYNGIRAAYSAGMKPIMVPDLLPATEEMREMSVVVLEDLVQVRQWFDDLPASDWL